MSELEGYKWSKRVIYRFIDLVKENLLDLQQGVKKSVWQKIAHILNEEYNIQITYEQVDSKWKGLKRTYRKVVEEQEQGNLKKHWEFFDLMNEIAYSFSGRSSILFESVGCNGENTQDDNYNGNKRVNKRKRVFNSINNENTMDSVEVKLNKSNNKYLDELNEEIFTNDEETILHAFAEQNEHDYDGEYVDVPTEQKAHIRSPVRVPVPIRKNMVEQSAQKRLDEAFYIIKEAYEKSSMELEKDECALYGELLAKKLRTLDEVSREEIMLQIDALVLRKRRKQNRI